MKPNTMLPTAVRIMDKRALSIMIAASLIFAVLTGYIQIIDHIGLRTLIHDLGHYSQALWQLTQGNMSMPVSVFGQVRPSFLIHINPILYVLAPVYAVFPSPYTLLILPPISTGTAGILIFLLSKSVLKNNLTALLFGIMLLINPMVQETTLFDFRPIALAMPLFLGALLSLEKRAWTPYWICIVLLIMVKEDMPFLVMALSPFVFFSYSRKHGITTLLLAALYLFGILYLTQKLFGAQTGQIAIEEGRFDYLGAAPMEMAGNLILHPEKTAFLFLMPNKIEYLIRIAFSGVYLSIFSPLAFLAVIPDLALNFLDQTGFQTRMGGVYYSGIVITALYASAIYGYKKLMARLPGLAELALISSAVYALALSMAISPIPYSKAASLEDYNIIHNRDAFKRISALIPQHAALATQGNIASHFAHRENITLITDNIGKADYILLHTLIPFARHNRQFNRDEYITAQRNADEFKALAAGFFSNPDFEVMAYDSGFFLLKRGHPAALDEEALAEAAEYLNEYGFDGDGDNIALKGRGIAW